MLHPDSKSLEIAAYKDCKRCEKLTEDRENIVWGQGMLNSPIMFIGECPGSKEATRGEPFVGPAGAVHFQLLDRAEIPPEWIYNTNAVLCRPTRITQEAPREVENRNPTSLEIDTCRPRLLQEIFFIDPLVIVAMGNSALRGLMGKDMRIGAKIGTAFDMHMNSPNGNVLTYCVVPIYHPSYILRGALESEINQNLRSLELARKIVESGLKRNNRK